MLECRCAFQGEITVIIFSIGTYPWLDGKLAKENFNILSWFIK